ncbi:MAG: ABC transporter substrate-binding protein [Propionibacteriaceae bacterium]|jgi:putative ABC transport system substrate-binding protein|nr:ABC transporter substrate-binding protein [Propionibacteriaceae bacterium]
MKSRQLPAALVAGLAALSLGLTGCGGSGTSGSASSSAPADAVTSEAPATTTTDDTITIGVAVYVDHPSLQLIRDGFEDYLTSQGVRATYKDANAQADGANVATIATTFAQDPDLDLILAITTPIAQAIVQQERDIPVIYAGVTDPADAGLVTNNEGPSGTNVTGTSDMNPNAKPVELITEIVPDVKTIGVLYSSSEPNSLVQVTAFENEAAPLGITIKPTAVTNTNEIATAVETMTDVDAILIPTDNTVVAGIAPVIAFGEKNQIPVFTADAESLSKGSIASRGLSYYEQGKETGEMAYKILVEKVPVGEVPAIISQQTQLYVNEEAAAAMGVTIPEALLKDATIVTTES